MTNPFGAPPRPAQPLEHGFSYSGRAAEVFGDGSSVGVLNIQIREFVPQGWNGVASVHVWTSDVTVQPPSQSELTGKLVLDVSWQSGDGGGDATVDATRGSFFTVGGINSINMKARFESAIAGAPIRIWATKQVTATVNWSTSINPKPARYTSPTIALLADTASGFLAIPQQARDVMVLSPEPHLLPTLTMEFWTSNLAGVPSEKYSTINPNANGTPIVHGVEFVRFLSPEPMRVFPSYELWL